MTIIGIVPSTTKPSITHINSASLHYFLKDTTFHDCLSTGGLHDTTQRSYFTLQLVVIMESMGYKKERKQDGMKMRLFFSTNSLFFI